MATKKIIGKKKSATPTGTANPQESVKKEFLMWLQKKFNIQDENQLKQKLQEMGDEGMQQEFAVFQQEKEQGQAIAMKKGGMLQRIQQLQEIKNQKKEKPEQKKLQMKNVETGTAELKTSTDKKALIKKKK